MRLVLRHAHVLLRLQKKRTGNRVFPIDDDELDQFPLRTPLPERPP